MGAETLKVFAEGWLSTLGFRYTEEARAEMVQREQEELEGYEGPVLRPRRDQPLPALVVNRHEPVAPADAPAAAEKSNAEKEFDDLIGSYLARMPAGMEFIPGLQQMTDDPDNPQLAYGYVSSASNRAMTSSFGMWQINRHHVEDALALVVELDKIRRNRDYKISTFKKLLAEKLSNTSRFGLDGRESQFWIILHEMQLDVDAVTDTCVIDDQQPLRNQRLDNLDEVRGALGRALAEKEEAERRARAAEQRTHAMDAAMYEANTKMRALDADKTKLSEQFAGAVRGRQEAERELGLLKDLMERLKKQHEEALIAAEARSAKALQAASAEVAAAKAENTNVDLYRSKMTAALEERARLDGDLNELKKQYKVLEAERDGLLKALETTNKVNGSNDEAQHKQIAELTKQVQELLAQADGFRKQIAKLRDEKEGIQESNVRVFEHNAELVAENKKLKALINGFTAIIQGLRRLITFLVAKYDYPNLNDPNDKFPHKKAVLATLSKKVAVAGIKLPQLPAEYQPDEKDYQDQEASDLLNEFRGYIKGAYENRSVNEGNQKLLAMLNAEQPIGGAYPVYFDGSQIKNEAEPQPARKTSDADAPGATKKPLRRKIDLDPPAAAPSSVLLQGQGGSPVASGALATAGVQSLTATPPRKLGGAPVVAAGLRLSSHSATSPLAPPAPAK